MCIQIALTIHWFYMLAGSLNLKKRKKEKGKIPKEIWSNRKHHPLVAENVGSMGSAIWAAVPTLSGSN